MLGRALDRDLDRVLDHGKVKVLDRALDHGRVLERKVLDRGECRSLNWAG